MNSLTLGIVRAPNHHNKPVYTVEFETLWTLTEEHVEEYPLIWLRYESDPTSISFEILGKASKPGKPDIT